MKILAISGSPVKNSNIDRTIQSIMESTGIEGDFIKLSKHKISPCRACLKCVDDNHCVQKDDYSEKLEGMLKEADALIIGGYPTFATLDGWTKTFCERTYSLRHNKVLTKGKLAIAVAGGYKANQMIEDWFKLFFKAQHMETIGTMKTCGNMTCLSCGSGEECAISNVKVEYGEDAIIDKCMFNSFDEKPELQEEAKKLGEKLRERLQGTK